MRVVRIYAVTARVLASYLWLRLQRPLIGRAAYSAKLARRHRANARRAERAIIRAGGLFIKVGQMISILSNFLPEEFRRELEGLQDQLPPRPYDEIAARIEAELGASPDALFARFERTPIATASLAQVHAATLADGRVVAVKVQHADIERIAHLDLQLIARILRIVQFVTGVRGIESYAPEISEMIADELDFSNEADNIDAFGARVAGVDRVRCPTVVRERCTRRVLTTEFVAGTKITDFTGLAARGLDRRALAEQIVTAYCRMIFVDGVYHADPHPGNILVAPDGAIVFIDFGAVGVLGTPMRDGAIAFVEGLIARDVPRMTSALTTMGFVARHGAATDIAQRVIEWAQGRLFDQVQIASWSLGDLQFDLRSRLDMLSELRRLDVSFRQLTAAFQVPKDWVLLERTLLLLLGLCTELDASWNPMTVIQPYLEDIVRDEERDWSQLIRGTVKEMAVRAIRVPEILEQVLGTANRGDLAVRVPEIGAAARLLYAAARQLIYSVVGVTCTVIAYQAYDRGRLTLAAWLAAGAALCVAAFVASSIRARHVFGD